MKCETQKPRMRIMQVSIFSPTQRPLTLSNSSLHSSQSVLPLEITEPLLRKVLTFHNVDSAFLNVLFSFGTAPNASESGSSYISNKTAIDASRNLSYQIRYVEENHRKTSQPFSPRQTGIYHHHSSDETLDLFIIVNPMEDSILELQLVQMMQSRTTALSICEHPFRLHLLLFALYIDNWRWYLRYIGEQLDRKVGIPYIMYMLYFVERFTEQ